MHYVHGAVDTRIFTIRSGTNSHCQVWVRNRSGILLCTLSHIKSVTFGVLSVTFLADDSNKATTFITVLARHDERCKDSRAKAPVKLAITAKEW